MGGACTGETLLGRKELLIEELLLEELLREELPPVDHQGRSFLKEELSKGRDSTVEQLQREELSREELLREELLTE